MARRLHLLDNSSQSDRPGSQFQSGSGPGFQGRRGEHSTRHSSRISRCGTPGNLAGISPTCRLFSRVFRVDWFLLHDAASLSIHPCTDLSISSLIHCSLI